jgi:3-hydroxybutyryl-CoA dehydratase
LINRNISADARLSANGGASADARASTGTSGDAKPSADGTSADARLIDGPLAFEALEAGMAAEYARTVGDADIVAFAEVSGDRNPAHLDEEAAARGPFGGRIAHGMLSAAYVSTALATKLPGPGTIYLSQSLRFVRPVRIGDTVTARVEVAEVIAAKRRVRLKTTCTNQRGETLLDGEALVMVPAEPA